MENFYLVLNTIISAEHRYALRVEKALSMLINQHSGQLDKSGYPYILHPLAVANSFNSGKHSFRYMAGLLHDIVEDNEEISFHDIQDIFGDKMAGVIYLLTRPNDLTYFQYIDRLIKSGNKDAMAVKLADLNHNLSRPGKIPDSLRERYVKAKGLIKAALKGGINS